MEAPTGPVAPPQEQQQQQQPAAGKTERLNPAVQQQLNLESVKTRALSLYKAISRILDEFDAYARTNTTPKWQDALGQFSMVNMELFNIVEDIKKVSKAFVVYPKNVTVENATILPVMLSSKLLPEMEAEDNAKRDQLLSGMQNLPIPMQIEKIKARIDMIAAACEAAEKVIADARKAYGLGSRQGPTLVPTLDKVQAAKIQEQENQLRAAVNYGEGLRIPVDQRHLPSSLPSHLIDVLTFGDSTQSFGDNSGKSLIIFFPDSFLLFDMPFTPSISFSCCVCAAMWEGSSFEPDMCFVGLGYQFDYYWLLTGIYQKHTPTFSSNNVNVQGGVMQAAGAQLIGRSVPSPSGVTGNTNFDNVNASTPPMPYANSPRSGTNMMNTPSPQQQSQQQQQRQKMIQMPQHQQQLLAQQQLRQSTNPGVLGQSTISQLHDLQGQAQQKFQQVPGQHQMQFSQSLSQSQFQNRQMQAAHLQHNIAQNQLNQGNQLRNHLNQFTGNASSALFNAAQSQSTSQMLAMQSQSILPRMQLGLSGGLSQRNHSSQMLNDQMFGVSGSNNASMVAMQQQQQQQHGIQGGYGNMNLQANTQNLQAGMVGLPNASQNLNFPQQRQQNQQ